MSPDRLVAALAARGETLAVAESCTGGGLGSAITSAAGASEVFWGGVISYDDAAKMALLGVSQASIRDDGAVSRQVALEMARGMRERASTTWSIAITGIAGPGGGTEEKPVGTVWIALDGPVCEARRWQFDGDRARVRAATVAAAMNWLGSWLDMSETNGMAGTE